MRLTCHVEVRIPEAAKTFHFLAEFIYVTGVLASSIGATAGAYIIISEFPGSVCDDQWTNWFIGDVSELYKSWKEKLLTQRVRIQVLANCSLVFPTSR